MAAQVSYMRVSCNCSASPCATACAKMSAYCWSSAWPVEGCVFSEFEGAWQAHRTLTYASVQACNADLASVDDSWCYT